MYIQPANMHIDRPTYFLIREHTHEVFFSGEKLFYQYAAADTADDIWLIFDKTIAIRALKHT